MTPTFRGGGKDPVMRALFPERLEEMRHFFLAFGLSAIALAVSLLIPPPLHGEGSATITGQVVNGTSGEVAPSSLEVNLHIISDSGEADVATTATDNDGNFQFQDVEMDDGSAYAVTTRYKDVLYSSRMDPSTLAVPVELTVYESTDSLGDLNIAADVLLIGGAEDKKSLSAVEVVSLVNVGDRTFMPDLSQPGNMNFLRFSVPQGTTGLDVGSDLPGGRIIFVGPGFALTAPVTPGPHQVSYSYQIPYNGQKLEFTRSFPMGAEIFRLLMEETLGNINASGPLAPQVPVDVGGESYSIWEASQLSPGERLLIEITDLPQPSLLQRVGDGLTDGPYLKVGIPAAVGLVLAGLLVYALTLKQRGNALAGEPGRGATAAIRLNVASLAGFSNNPGGSAESERRSLVEAIARLDELFERGEITPADYRQPRQELKARLLRLAVTSGEEAPIE